MAKLTENEGKVLVKLARKSIKTYFEKKEPEIDPNKLPKSLKEKRGVFVTLKKDKKLRGCIGYPYATKPLYEAVILSARSSAFSDPRFFPLRENELDEIKIEISILSEPEELKGDPKDYPKQIEIGKHGLIVKRGLVSGLLLPQVSKQFHWDAETFLIQTCIKANLPGDSWLDKNTKVYRFTAQIFTE